MSYASASVRWTRSLMCGPSLREVESGERRGEEVEFGAVAEAL
jgi:hypothetical protein